MGFFSWMTQDTGESIPSKYSNRATFPVYMYDDKGNVWKEEEYEGYGEFGGKDYYELLSEMNGGPSDRSHGISLAFGDGFSNGENPNVKHPNLVTEDTWKWVNRPPETCPDQGFFYEDEGDEEDSYGIEYDEHDD